MAKGNGNTRSGNPSSPKGLATNGSGAQAQPVIRATDRGMTDKQRAKVLAFENQHKNADTEYGMTIDKDGNVWQQKKGTKTAVSWYGYEVPADGVLTHNHPLWTSITKESKLYSAVGSPFSMQDLRFAIQFNLAEIRAVTPGYTFSFRRPAGGWPPYSTVAGRTTAIMRKRNKEARDYYNAATGDERRQRIARVNITIFHRAAEDLAKLTGATYTRSRNTK